MKNDELRAEIDNLKNKALLMVQNAGGLGPEPGFGGIAILENGEVYKFELHLDFKERKEVGEVVLFKTVPNEVVDKIKTFLEEEKVIETEYENILIFDASFDVYVNYKGVHKNIRNNISHDKDNELIYNKAYRILSELIK